MNRYHHIYSNYLAKIQACRQPWPWPEPVNASGPIIEFDFKPRIFTFEGLKHEIINYSPAFEIKIQEPGNPEPTTFYIDVSGTKYALEMKEIRRLIKYYRDEKIIIVDRKFFDNKSNIAKLKKMGIWDIKTAKQRKADKLAAEAAEKAISDELAKPLDKTTDGYYVVKTMADYEKAAQLQVIYVSCVCPKCNDSWTSLLPNARQILTTGCVACNPVEPEIIIEPITTEILNPMDYIKQSSKFS